MILAKNPRNQSGAINDTRLRFFEDYQIQNSHLRDYANIIETVDGWLWKGDLQVLDWISQRDFNRYGGVLELGVHLGKLFIAMNMTVEQGESYAVDIFTDLQEYNVSHSGGNVSDQIRKFRTNVETYDTRWNGFNVQIIAEDTMVLRRDHFGDNKFRVISIDAGHHSPHVMSDLRLAKEVLARDGVVIVDDWMNSEWPGVTEGTIQFLSGNNGLVPFMSYHHKLYLCRYNAHHKWIDQLTRFGYRRNETKLCGYQMYNICEKIP